MEFYLNILFLILLLNNEKELKPSPRPGKDYALFFAIDDYSGTPGFTSLKNPGKDADALAGELKAMYGFETEVYKNYTKAQIYQVLESWQKKTFAEDAQLFIFFSGHGTFWEFTKKGYFVPNGSQSDYSAYIELTDLGNIVTQIPCKHILLAIDACYSGTIDQAIAFKGKEVFRRPGDTPSSDRDNLINRQLRNPSRLLLTSGGKERTPDGATNSPFAAAILKGLRSAYTSGDGLFTYADLLSALERVSPTPHQGELPGHEQGGFVFVTESPTPQPLTVEPPQPIIPDDFVFVKGGTYQMGDQFGEGGDNEKTVHSVTVSDFYMGMYELTFEEYDAFCSVTGREKPSDSGWGRGKRPIINVSWYDAIEYCNWRSRQEGLQEAYTIDKSRKDANNTSSYDDVRWTVTCNWAANGYRLPTEAEWEYAVRGSGKKVRFGNGQDIARASQINFNASADYKKDYSESGTYRGKTVEVGSLNSSNALGLHDLSGNVWEWCWDWYAPYSPDGGLSDPRGALSGSYRVGRGGPWNYGPADCRAANRSKIRPLSRDFNLGFRLVRH
ncbi:MAG: SUMF1/EgtB/PvdO family nonheme iron enzyme [Saprospiraceae bacterium]|nr:SUMF1/EgtB/PvdO family nonheme iron enzyme [Saprospiraceae bacterium]